MHFACGFAIWGSDVSSSSRRPFQPFQESQPHPFKYGRRKKSCTDLLGAGVSWLVSETPPPPPRTCLPPASWFRLFWLLCWPPGLPGLLASLAGASSFPDCLSCVFLPSVAPYGAPEPLFYDPNWPRSHPPFPVPPAATQSVPANRRILGSKPHVTVAEARRSYSAKQPWKAGQAACSRLCQHPRIHAIHASTLTAILASRSFLILPMSHGRSASLPNPPSFLFSPFCNRIAWIACPAVRAETDHCSTQHTAHRRFRTPSRCLHQPATLTPLGAVSKKGPGRRSLSFRRFAGSSSGSLVRSFARYMFNIPHTSAHCTAVSSLDRHETAIEDRILAVKL